MSRPPKPPTGDPQLDRSGCPARYHGTASAYDHENCRCPDAMADRQRAVLESRLRVAARAGRPAFRRIPVLAARRRVHGLLADGWDLATQHRISGVSLHNLHKIVARSVLVYHDTDQAIAAMFSRRAGRPGPAWVEPRHSSGTAWARRRNYAPAHAWNGLDIADPDTTPWHYGWDIDEIAIEQAMAWVAGRAGPRPQLNADSTAAVVGRIILTAPEPAAALHRVFDRAHRHCTRIVAAGGLTARQARHFPLRDQPLALNDRDMKEAAA